MEHFADNIDFDHLTVRQAVQFERVLEAALNAQINWGCGSREVADDLAKLLVRAKMATVYACQREQGTEQ